MKIENLSAFYTSFKVFNCMFYYVSLIFANFKRVREAIFSDYANRNPRNHFIFYQKLGSNNNSISNVHLHSFCKVTAATRKCSVCDYRIYSSKHPGRFLTISYNLLYIFCVYWRGAFI